MPQCGPGASRLANATLALASSRPERVAMNGEITPVCGQPFTLRMTWGWVWVRLTIYSITMQPGLMGDGHGWA